MRLNGVPQVVIAVLARSLAFTGALFVVTYGLQYNPVNPPIGQASDGCIEPERHILSTGQNKDGSPWRILATIRNSGRTDKGTWSLAPTRPA